MGRLIPREAYPVGGGESMVPEGEANLGRDGGLRMPERW